MAFIDRTPNQSSNPAVKRGNEPKGKGTQKSAYQFFLTGDQIHIVKPNRDGQETARPIVLSSEQSNGLNKLFGQQLRQMASAGDSTRRR